MQKLYALLFLFLPIMSAEHSSKKTFRTTFEDSLYKSQAHLGVMDEETYKQFIKSYLDEAEETLQIPAACENDNTAQCARYLKHLVKHNALMFQAYILPRTLKNHQLKESRQKLNLDMTVIAVDNKELHIDTQAEFVKTEALLLKANKAYYTHLGLGKKLSISAYGWWLWLVS